MPLLLTFNFPPTVLLQKYHTTGIICKYFFCVILCYYDGRKFINRHINDPVICSYLCCRHAVACFQ